jgi:glycosyltransferase involved in cell wall biosynthesis
MTNSIDRSSNHPKVSVCIITYNQERYIRECLESLVNQETDFNFEIIVGDDCSTDGTRQIVQEFVDRYPALVRAQYQTVNTGGSRNNLEIHAAALGDYVAHMDGDDIALTGKLKAMADVLDGDKACTAVWHKVDFFNDAGALCSGATADWSSFVDGQISFADSVRLGSVGVFSALMYRRAARTPVPLERQILDLYFTWDLLSKGHGVMMEQVLGRYRVLSSGSQTSTRQEQGHRLSIEHAREFLERYPDRAPEFMKWALSRALLDARNRRRTSGDFLKFAWHIRRWIWPLSLYRNLLQTRAVHVRWDPTAREQQVK